MQLFLRSRPRHLIAGVSALAMIGAVGGLAYADGTTGPVTPRAAIQVQDDGYADLVEAVMPAVVSVRVEATITPTRHESRGRQMPPDMEEFFKRFFGDGMPFGMPMEPPGERHIEGQGSGFIIDASGHIVTNAHVVNNADEISVKLADGRTLQADVIGIDEKTDLALIKVEADEPLPYVEFADSDETRVGERVIAVGNPFGLGGTVTAGIISAKGREIGSGPYDDFLQIDAAINRGNSGGPTFNLDGRVVGVNTLIFSPSGGGNVGIGFAIASNLVQEVVEDLMDDGQVQRGWLGVNIQAVDEDIAAALSLDSPKGALVSDIVPDSPASGSGLKRGDLIVEYDGKPIAKLRDLTRAVAATDPGEKVDITVLRDGKKRDIEVEIGLMPGSDTQVASADAGDADQPRLGLSLAPLSPEQRSERGLGGKEGVLVAGVSPGSPAEAKGLARGDIILEVNGKTVATPQDVIDAVRATRESGKDVVLMLVDRDGRQIFNAVPFDLS